MNVQNRKLSELTPYPGNAKKHDEKQIANVAESIRQYGFVQPIVVARDDVIIIGHCRALAAKKLGMDEVPCCRMDDLTPEQVNALRLVDNLRYLVGMEALYAAQAVDLRDNIHLGKCTQIAYDVIREKIPTLDEPRSISGDILKAYDLIRSGVLLERIPSV